MRQRSSILESQINTARTLWGDLPSAATDSLIRLVKRFGISVSLGDVQYIDGRWYVTHSGLLRIAHRRGCSGLETSLLTKFCDSGASRWVFRATVFKSRRSRGFVGYGDADPSNTSPWSVVAKCESPKLEPSTGPSEKPTESGSVASKSSDRFLLRKSPPRSRRIQIVIPDATAQAMDSRGCVTDCAC